MAGGSLLGCVVCNFVADRVGRRDMLGAGAASFIVGAAIMSASQDIPMLIVARVINGFAVGLISAQAPMYIAEMTTPKRRGRMISFQNWMISWGQLIMYYLSYGTSFMDGYGSFRVPWALQMVPAIVLLCAIPMMPRSPRWLSSQDRWDEAHDVLARVHGKGNRHDPLVLAQLEEIKEKVLKEKGYSSSWFELFTRKNVFRTQCAVFGHVWSQFSGINVMKYYVCLSFLQWTGSATDLLHRLCTSLRWPAWVKTVSSSLRSRTASPWESCSPPFCS